MATSTVKNTRCLIRFSRFVPVVGKLMGERVWPLMSIERREGRVSVLLSVMREMARL